MKQKEQEWKDLLDQIDQAVGTLQQCYSESMSLIHGSNWSRTWRGDVRKGRVPQAEGTISGAISSCILQMNLQVKTVNLVRDMLGLPRNGVEKNGIQEQ
jgi:hypothetical protein